MKSNIGVIYGQAADVPDVVISLMINYNAVYMLLCGKSDQELRMCACYKCQSVFFKRNRNSICEENVLLIFHSDWLKCMFI